jgi:putative endonuclease
LASRVNDHKEGIDEFSFTYKYKCHDLVYYAIFPTIEEAIAREKQIKKWKREWKEKLISDFNPKLRDLSGDIGEFT